MHLTVIIEANTKTYKHWSNIASFIPNTKFDLVRITFGYSELAVTRPSTFYEEGRYGFHSSFIERFRIDKIDTILPSHPKYHEYIKTRKPTQPPLHSDPLIFSLFIISFPVDFSHSDYIIRDTQFPCIMLEEPDKKPHVFWQTVMKKIARTSRGQSREMWRHCVNVYAYDWLNFFTHDANANYHQLSPRRQRLQVIMHHLIFFQMMSAFYRSQLSKETIRKHQNMFHFIPPYAFVHHHQHLTGRPDALFLKLIEKYKLNIYISGNPQNY